MNLFSRLIERIKFTLKYETQLKHRPVYQDDDLPF